MGELGNMKVTVGADIADLLAGMQRAGKSLSDFQSQLNRFKSSLATATDPSQIIRLNRAIQATEQRIAAINSAGKNTSSGLGSIGQVAQKTGRDFTGLSRILQDLPFGFIGISNNLTQILPAAGVAGLAISALVSAITFAQTGTDNWTRGLNSNKDALKDQADAVKKAAEDQKSYNTGLNEAVAQGIATGASLKAYVAIARDSLKPMAERNEALDRANEILGKHGEKLTLVNINTAAATKEIENFTEALIQQGLATKYQQRIVDLIVKQREQKDAFNAATREEQETRKKYRAEIDKNYVAEISSVNAVIAATQKSNQTAKDYNTTVDDIKKAYSDLNSTVQQATSLFAGLGESDKDDKKAKKVRTIADVVKDLRKELQTIDQNFDANIISPQSLKTDQIEAYKKAIKELFDLGATNQTQVVQQLRVELQPLFEVMGKKIDATTTLSDIIGLAPQTIPAEFKLTTVGGVTDDTLERQKAYNALITETKDIMGVLSPTINTLFNSILQGQNVFKSLGDALKQLVVQLIQSVIKAAAFAAIFSIISGGASNAAGGGLSFLGALKKYKIPGFADGVSNFRGGLALVGERGPELLRLPSGSDVIPNHQLGDIAGGGTQVFIPQAVLRGQDIYVSFLRAQQQRGRNG